jgi:hypothetical protein
MSAAYVSSTLRPRRARFSPTWMPTNCCVASTSWLRPYSGVNSAKVLRSGENWLSEMNRPPAKEHSVSASAMADRETRVYLGV